MKQVICDMCGMDCSTGFYDVEIAHGTTMYTSVDDNLDWENFEATTVHLCENCLPKLKSSVTLTK